ncbi:methylglyoxal synthase [Clostridium saccharoperbutylacetonicum]|uniref:methylglyoxal synthase n=1 Tax=Clostridium saccharoperbutylacetonicum TaxID=36745 RepID=UPI0009839B81|nr:methylglyoxal synthase [Clostridium saccharoperbutylacetonicum]AQR96728.1 methylglyoxal synthase [Clostridium saccharoperbutylacetonicum]NSB32605.1 methylglyoxal synthase [Clostridium saccharoperbutylacetonicum]
MNNRIKKQKKIALIAHDNRKTDLISWVKKNNIILGKHFLCGTGTTSKLISEETSLPVKPYRSGPLGGDQQIGAAIVDGEVDFMIFFWDPLTSQPHDPDVKALLRIAVLFDIPVAMNQSSADFLLNSSFMDEEYEKNVVDYTNTIVK